MPKCRHQPETHRPDVRLCRRAGGLALACALLGACAGGGPKTLVENRPYPQQRQAETLDVHVYRRGTTIDITNSTANTLGPGTLWLNMWFSRELEALPPGARVNIHLAEFKDQYGEAFRAGGFWATQAPDRLALAQLELPAGEGTGRLVGLVVVGDATGR
jgi:hypothetical protein